jgi:hypothetical protein
MPSRFQLQIYRWLSVIYSARPSSWLRGDGRYVNSGLKMERWCSAAFISCSFIHKKFRIPQCIRRLAHTWIRDKCRLYCSGFQLCSDINLHHICWIWNLKIPCICTSCIYTLYKHSRQTNVQGTSLLRSLFQGKWQAVPHDTWGRVSYSTRQSFSWLYLSLLYLHLS